MVYKIWPTDDIIQYHQSGKVLLTSQYCNEVEGYVKSGLLLCDLHVTSSDDITSKALINSA